MTAGTHAAPARPLPSAFARIWLWIFGLGYALCFALLVQTLFTTIPYGDLARIGRLSEDDFGWRIDPPHVDPQLLRGVPLAQADILVIGDSFSGTHRWQSQLVRGGYRVTTTFWSDVQETLCDDFDGWLAASGFRGRLVVVESVERLLAWRLDHVRECKRMKKPFSALPDPPFPPLDKVPGFALNWKGQLFSGFLTARCTRAAIAGEERRFCNQETKVRPVPNGCALLSNRRCDMAIFLAEDWDNGELTPAHAAQMQSFSQAQGAVPILWMVVPNKTTAYLEPARSQAFAGALAAADLGPDLFGFAQEQKTRLRDFYLPNDTHISMQGQLALGERMLRAVRERLGEPAAGG